MTEESEINSLAWGNKNSRHEARESLNAEEREHLRAAAIAEAKERRDERLLEERHNAVNLRLKKAEEAREKRKNRPAFGGFGSVWGGVKKSGKALSSGISGVGSQGLFGNSSISNVFGIGGGIYGTSRGSKKHHGKSLYIKKGKKFIKIKGKHKHHSNHESHERGFDILGI